MKKFKHDDIPPVEKENERDENYQGTNSKIDNTRTKHNIHLVKREQSYIGYINQQIKELGCRTKKDTVLMCSMLVSASPDFFKGMLPEHIREYFAMCYRFFAERYGEENIIGAVVHMDETTPHMHLNLMPVLDGRLCCKHLFDRVALQKLQTDIYEQVGKHWGLERGKEGSKTKHLDVAGFKVKMAEEKAAEITTAYSKTSSELTKLKAEKRNTHTEVESLTTQRETLSQEIDELTEVKISADEPIPLFGKDKIITSLRVENTQLRQQLSDRDSEVARAHQDQAFMYKRLQSAERTAESCEKSHSEVTEIKAVLPKEYEELLRRARTTKAATPHKSPTKFNGNSK
jgi:hypothetical protein